MTNNRLAMICAVAALVTIAALSALAFAAPCPPGDVLVSPRVVDVLLWRSLLIEPGMDVYALDVNGTVVGMSYTLYTEEGTASILMHVYGDYPGTPEDEGLEAGETFWLRYHYGDGYCGEIRLQAPPRFENFGYIDLIETAPDTSRPNPQIRVLPPGDITSDGTLSVTDFVMLGGVVFRGAEMVPGCDVNGDGQATIADVVLLADVIFRGGDARRLRW